MGVPKRRQSSARTRRRRNGEKYRVKLPCVSYCNSCGRVVRPHFKCEFCGYYGESKQQPLANHEKTADKKAPKAKDKNKTSGKNKE